MALTVEDGTGMSTADSYVSAADFLAMAADLGLSYLGEGSWLTDAATPDVESALRRAAVALDGIYYDRWQGFRTHLDQALQWPRSGVLVGSSVAAASAPIMYSAARLGRRSYSYGGVTAALSGYIGTAVPQAAFLAEDSIPPQVVAAQVQFAARELASPGSVLPDVVDGGIASESVGPVQVAYVRAAQVAPPRIPTVDNLLRALLRGSGGAVAVVRA